MRYPDDGDLAFDAGAEWPVRQAGEPVARAIATNSRPLVGGFRPAGSACVPVPRAAREAPDAPLHELAHCRAGYKGNVATLSVFPYDDTLFSLLAREVTAERVRAHLAEYVEAR